MIDDGRAVHYTAVERGTPVYGADGVQAGTVRRVVDNYREHILDGIVVDTREGRRVFVDGPEVERTAERGVTLNIAAGEVERLPAPDRETEGGMPGLGAGKLSGLLRGARKRD